MHRIFFIDDHPMLRAGLTHLIQRLDGFEICGEAGSATEALQLVPEVKPDMVVMDLSLPDRNGLELIREFRALCPEVPVLVLSMHDELVYAERVIRAGGRGYVMKESAAGELLEAIQKVLDGSVFLSDRASAHILGSLVGRGNASEASSRFGRLTDREFEVFELISRGMNSHDIAQQLQISPRTVDAHRAHIRKRLGLPDLAALMRYAVRWAEAGADEKSA